MVSPETFTIGRAPGCEIHLAEASVSRRHAELVIGIGDVVYIVDCKSSHGTFVISDGDWMPIKQIYVKKTDRIRLGEYQSSVAALMEMIRKSDPRPSTEPMKLKNGRAANGKKAREKTQDDDRPSGRVRRNPVSGEIEADI